MKRLVTFLAVLMCAIGSAPSSASSQSPAPAALPPVTLSVPSGSKLAFVFLRPEFAKSARAGDLIYMQTSYPVVVANQVAIPAGSFLQGSLHSLTKPTRKSSHALLTIDFQKLILPNGYSVLLNEQQTLNMQVSYASDLVLDNGTQAEISLVSPIKLNAAHVAASLALAKAPRAETMHSATRCLPTPATEGSPGMPGTPDTIIPGNPGTPDQVIPGADGGPDTVIPGIPATAPTVIPGTPATPDSPGSPEIPCPAPPLFVGSTPSPATPAPATPSAAINQVKP